MFLFVKYVCTYFKFKTFLLFKRSQNESLRAEIEAQSTAYKLQIATLESRAHEAWLGARQAERRLEETKVEAAGLRRKLTSFAEGSDLLYF